MQLHQNGEFLAEIVSKTQSIDPTSDLPTGVFTARPTYTLVLSTGSVLKFLHDAQYTIQEGKKPDQSITIISATGNTVKCRNN